ncbi:RNA-processing protein [Candidatus Woesearchaeota archaeon]|nr:RNA-processing protein [Candidatus Woesearchaeota archaeon]
MTEFSYELKIPKERIAVLIGTKGEAKKELEDATHTHIKIDSQEGDVFITGSDALFLFSAKEVITAIARGFNPDIAFLLLKQEYSLEVISMQDFAKTKNHLLRLKGRVIGKEGKARRLLEELTETYLSVYGKTIAIVGETENVSACRRAVQALIGGSPHSSVYKFLEKRRAELRRMRITGELK